MDRASARLDTRRTSNPAVRRLLHLKRSRGLPVRSSRELSTMASLALRSAVLDAAMVWTYPFVSSSPRRRAFLKAAQKRHRQRGSNLQMCCPLVFRSRGVRRPQRFLTRQRPTAALPAGCPQSAVSLHSPICFPRLWCHSSTRAWAASPSHPFSSKRRIGAYTLKMNGRS